MSASLAGSTGQDSCHRPVKIIVAEHLKNDTDRVNVQHLKNFLLNSQDMHMFLCSHLFYPRTRIITFAEEKPIIIMYKEMQPLKLIVE
jgi:hypothetical protein